MIVSSFTICSWGGTHGVHLDLSETSKNFAPMDLIDLDVRKEWVDPKAHIIWEKDHQDPKRWRMDQHSLDEADDRCAKVGA